MCSRTAKMFFHLLFFSFIYQTIAIPTIYQHRKILSVSDNNENLPQTNSFDENPLNRIMQEFEQSAFQIPQIMDHVFSNALFSMDRASGGLFSSLTGPEIDFAKSDNGTHLIARIRIPSSQSQNSQDKRILSLAVLGKQHLRMKIETKSDHFVHASTHTIPLPEPVASEAIHIQTMPDGTIHAYLKRLQTNNDQKQIDDDDNSVQNSERFNSQLQNSFWIPSLFKPPQADSKQNEVVEQLPPASDIQDCHKRYADSKLMRKKCNCDVIPSDDSRAVCYGKLISKSINMARKLGWNNFATSAKHMAIECTNNTRKNHCLNGVLQSIVNGLSQEKDPHSNNDQVASQIREAIESQDDGPSNFQPSPVTIFIRLFFAIFLVILCLLFTGLCLLKKRTTENAITQLSSVLTQTVEQKTSATNIKSSTSTATGAAHGKKILSKDNVKLS